MPITVGKQNSKRAKKIKRVEARLNPEQKRRIEYAATLKGTSVSEFLVLSADEAAARTIQEHEIWHLSGADRAAFVNALLNPPAPSPRMLAAAERYRARMRA
jgi:uncharacterized protein (DUF1778 family)